MKQPTGIEKKHYKENFNKNTPDHYNTEGQNKQENAKNKNSRCTRNNKNREKDANRKSRY
jgi:hypothetical protein